MLPKFVWMVSERLYYISAMLSESVVKWLAGSGDDLVLLLFGIVFQLCCDRSGTAHLLLCSRCWGLVCITWGFSCRIGSGFFSVAIFSLRISVTAVIFIVRRIIGYRIVGRYVYTYIHICVYTYIYITYYILHITYYILPIDCLLIAYRLPLMPICSAIMDMGPGPGPRAQKLLGRVPGQGPQLLGPGPGPRAHIHYGWAYGHQGQSIGNR